MKQPIQSLPKVVGRHAAAAVAINHHQRKKPVRHLHKTTLQANAELIAATKLQANAGLMAAIKLQVNAELMVVTKLQVNAELMVVTKLQVNAELIAAAPLHKAMNKSQLQKRNLTIRTVKI